MTFLMTARYQNMVLIMMRYGNRNTYTRHMLVGGLADIDIEPDDIDVSDTATFVWEIK